MSTTDIIAYLTASGGVVEVDATHPLPVTNTPSGTQTVDTELPAASALNGTILKSVSAPVVGAALMASDGTNLVQPLGDAANGLDVDVTRITAPATATYGAIAPTAVAASALAALTARTAVTFYNEGAVKVYLGSDSNLTTSNGYPLPPGGSHTVESGTVVWMVTSSGTGDVRYWAERY